MAMRPRSSMPEKERHARSRLAKIVHDYPFILGSVVEMRRVCGKPECKCTKGEKHTSAYLSVRQNTKRKMIYIPKKWEAKVGQWVKTHNEMKELIRVISNSCLNRLIESKKGD